MDKNLHNILPFLFTVYCPEQFCQRQNCFPEKLCITLYLFGESSKYSTISLVYWKFSLSSLLVSVFLPYVFLFLSRFFVSLKFLLSTKASTFLANIFSGIFYYWHACAQMKKLQQKGALSVIWDGVLIWGEWRDISYRRYIIFKTIYVF